MHAIQHEPVELPLVKQRRDQHVPELHGHAEPVPDGLELLYLQLPVTIES